jgi:hypothetical protein
VPPPQTGGWISPENQAAGILYKKTVFGVFWFPDNALLTAMPSLILAPAPRRNRSPLPSGTTLPAFASAWMAPRHAGRFARFIAADRDRWVPLVCGIGFALLMWVDWLAA